MEKALLLDNIDYNFKSLVISKKQKSHKLFQQFIDYYCISVNQRFKSHLDYVKNYLNENNITFSDPKVIHYIALNFCILNVEIAFDFLYNKNKESFLITFLIAFFQDNFAHLKNDINKRGHGTLRSYQDNILLQLDQPFTGYKACNEDNEVYFRRLLITDAEKSTIMPFVDGKKINKEQLLKNIDYFNSAFFGHYFELTLIATPEILKADKDLSVEFRNILKKVESRKSIAPIAKQEAREERED